MKTLAVHLLLDYLLLDHTKSLEPAWPGKKKVELRFEFEAMRNDTGQLQAIETSYPQAQWRSRCDFSGLTVFNEHGSRVFSWADLPKELILGMDLLHSALHLHRNDLIPFPIAKRGPWSEFECPGWFGLGLYNGLLKSGCKQIL